MSPYTLSLLDPTGSPPCYTTLLHLGNIDELLDSALEMVEESDKKADMISEDEKPDLKEDGAGDSCYAK